MLIASWPTSLSPGNEQSFRWSAAAADREGSLNLPGVRSPAADAAIAALVGARSREELTTAARALDRVLLSGFYVAPLYHAPDLWLAYGRGLRRPASVPKLGIPIELWWRAAE
jgi:peptide/nickel transport system substrate-binding protein